MSEFVFPKFKYKPLTQEQLLQEVSELSYQPVINILQGNLREQVEGDVIHIIQSYGIDIDKDELVKALKYDRDQYRKGFAHGSKLKTDTIEREVAMEIFEEIDELIFQHGRGDLADKYFYLAMDELKKKYTEEK